MSLMVVDPYRFGRAVDAATFVIGVNSSTVTTSFSYSASGLNLTDPLIIVAGGVRDSGFTFRIVSSVTVDGVAATQLCASTSDSFATGAFWVPHVTSASPTIVITFNNNMGGVVAGHMQLLRATSSGYSQRTGATPRSQAAGTVSTDVAVTIPTNGIGIGVCVGFDPTTQYTWSLDNSGPGTEQADAGNGVRFGVFSTKDTGATIYSATSTSTSRHILAFTWALAPEPLHASGTPPPTATTGANVNFTPGVNGGYGSNVWSVDSGSLATGLSLNTSTGAVTGIATTAGSYTVTLKVTDAQGHTSTVPWSITVTGSGSGNSFDSTSIKFDSTTHKMDEN